MKYLTRECQQLPRPVTSLIVIEAPWADHTRSSCQTRESHNQVYVRDFLGSSSLELVDVHDLLAPIDHPMHSTSPWSAHLLPCRPRAPGVKNGDPKHWMVSTCWYQI